MEMCTKENGLKGKSREKERCFSQVPINLWVTGRKTKKMVQESITKMEKYFLKDCGSMASLKVGKYSLQLMKVNGRTIQEME